MAEHGKMLKIAKVLKMVKVVEMAEHSKIVSDLLPIVSVMYDRNHKGHATARGTLYLKHWRKYEIVMREILMIESKQIQSDQCDIPAQKQRQ